MAAHSPFSRIPCAPQRMQSLLKPEERYSPELTHASSGHGSGTHPVATPSKPVIFLWVKSARQLFARLSQDFHRIKCSAEKATRVERFLVLTFHSTEEYLPFLTFFVNLAVWTLENKEAMIGRSCVQSPASGCKRGALSYLLPNLEIKRSQ